MRFSEQTWREISCLAEEPLDLEEGLCPMELFVCLFVIVVVVKRYLFRFFRGYYSWICGFGVLTSLKNLNIEYEIFRSGFWVESGGTHKSFRYVDECSAVNTITVIYDLFLTIFLSVVFQCLTNAITWTSLGDMKQNENSRWLSWIVFLITL